jgi:hypothetical protein
LQKKATTIAIAFFGGFVAKKLITVMLSPSSMLVVL